MLDKITTALGWLALVAGLSLPAILPEVANVSTLVLMGTGLILLVADSGSRRVLRQPAVWVPLVAGAFLSLALLFTATSPLHLMAIFVLAPLFLVGPLAALFRRLPVTPTLIGVFSLVGATGATAIAVYDVFARGLSRGGELFNNVIHFADLTLAIGFVGLVGIFGVPTRKRLVFILCPLLALIAVLLANSRGPILAAIPMVIASAVIISAIRLPRKWIAPTAAATLVLILGAGYLAYVLGYAGRLERLGSIFTVISTGSVGDSRDAERYHMYASAWNALKASPIFGHGLIDYTQSAARYAPPGPVQFKPSQHLHNDMADFAVIGGGIGLVSYALFLLAPFVGALSAKGQCRNATLYLGVVIPVGYFAMGLTNAMIGILTQTIVYSVVLALIGSLASAEQTRASGGRMD